MRTGRDGYAVVAAAAIATDGRAHRARIASGQRRDMTTSRNADAILIGAYIRRSHNLAPLRQFEPHALRKRLRRTTQRFEPRGGKALA